MWAISIGRIVCGKVLFEQSWSGKVKLGPDAAVKLKSSTIFMLLLKLLNLLSFFSFLSSNFHKRFLIWSEVGRDPILLPSIYKLFLFGVTDAYRYESMERTMDMWFFARGCYKILTKNGFNNE